MGSSEKVGHGNGQEHVLYLGSRKSRKLIRCYRKEALGAFRVELELHSSFLRRHQNTRVEGLAILVPSLCPSHVRFVALDWVRLERYLTKSKGQRGQAILAGARERAASIHRACRYLRRHGVNNPHRFLVPLRINKQISAALYRWADEFMPEVRWISTN